MGIIGIAFGLGFILGPFIGGELARFPLLGREGTLAGVRGRGAVGDEFSARPSPLPESLPREARGRSARRAVPSTFRLSPGGGASPAWAPRSPSTSCSCCGSRGWNRRSDCSPPIASGCRRVHRPGVRARRHRERVMQGRVVPRWAPGSGRLASSGWASSRKRRRLLCWRSPGVRRRREARALRRPPR